jgi:hypothetical protein
MPIGGTMSRTIHGGRRFVVVVAVALLAALALAACGGASKSATSKTTANASKQGVGRPPTTARGTAGKHDVPKLRCPHKKCPSTNAGGTAGTRKAGHSNNAVSPAIQHAAAKLVSCMREHGQKMRSPNTSGKGPILDTSGLDKAGAKFKAAFADCSSKAQSTSKPKPPKAGGPGVSGGPAGRGTTTGSGPAISAATQQALAKLVSCMREHGQNMPAANTSGKGPIIDTSGLNTSSAAFKAAFKACSQIPHNSPPVKPSAGVPPGQPKTGSSPPEGATGEEPAG